MGSGFGKSTGATIPAEIEEAAGIFQDIGRQQLDIGNPFLATGTADASTILAGGIPESLRPAVLTNLEAGRAAASEALTTNREQATLAGLTGSALEENLAGSRLAAEQQVGAIPSQFTLPVLQGGASQIFGLPEAGLQSLIGAATAGASGAIPGRQAGGAAGGLAGAAGGALAGAQLGSIFPGYGTAIGAIAGGLLGGLGGAK